MIEGKAVARFGKGDILMTSLCNEDRGKCCVVLHNQAAKEIGEEVSTDGFHIEEDDTLLVFTSVNSIDVLIDKLFEAKLMMKGAFKAEKTIEQEY